MGSKLTSGAVQRAAQRWQSDRLGDVGWLSDAAVPDALESIVSTFPRLWRAGRPSILLIAPSAVFLAMFAR